MTNFSVIQFHLFYTYILYILFSSVIHTTAYLCWDVLQVSTSQVVQSLECLWLELRSFIGKFKLDLLNVLFQSSRWLDLQRRNAWFLPFGHHLYLDQLFQGMLIAWFHFDLSCECFYKWRDWLPLHWYLHCHHLHHACKQITTNTQTQQQTQPVAVLEYIT